MTVKKQEVTGNWKRKL